MLFADEPTDLSTLRDVLAAARFDVAGISDVIGPNGFGFLAKDELGPLLRRTAGGFPIETLIRLFLCGVAAPRDAVARALAPLTVDACIAAGLLAGDGGDVRARVLLWPVSYEGTDWLIPFDATRAGDRAADYVLGVGPASMTLAGLTIRRPVRRCLDLGAGSGVQALFASTHAAHVVATDRNARATAFARLAMRLNGIDNVELREGDLFEPVTDERFDLIVSNPPFVISPGAQFIYRDSGLAGDEICRRIVAEAPQHLEENGWCQLLANWAHLKGVHWQDRLAEWIDDIGCDAWIVQSRVEDAETYATNWLRHDDPAGATTARFDEWMDHYDDIGLEAVGFGLITLRRTSRPNPWLRIEELAQDFALPCGDDIAAAFDRGVWLSDHAADDQSLLGATLVVNPTMQRRDTHYAAEGEWYLDQSVLQLERGLAYAAQIDSFGAELVAGCDGGTRVGELVARLADAIGADATAITPHSLAIIRRMIQQGFVTPTIPPG